MPQQTYPREVIYIGPPPENKLGRRGFWTSLFGLATCGLLSPVGLTMSFLALSKKPRGAALAGVFLGLIGSAWVALLGAAMIGSAQGAAAMQAQRLETQTQTAMVQAEGVISHHRGDTGRLPEGIEGNKLVLSFTDAWGHALRYDRDDNAFAIRSAGPDGEFDTSDDLVNSHPLDSKP